MPKPRQATTWVKVADNLQRHKSGLYYALLREEGKQRRIPLKTRNVTAAKAYLVDLKSKLTEGRVTPDKMTLEAFVDRFLSVLTGAKNTVDQERRSALMLRERFGRTMMHQIRHSDLLSFLKDNFGHKSASYYNENIRVLRKFFALAKRDGVILNNPTEGLKYRRRPDLRRPTPTTKEVEAILEDILSQTMNARRQESADFLALMAYAGFGQAEIRNLTWGDIDLANREIVMRRQKTQRIYRVPICSRLLEMLKRRKQSETNANDRVIRIDDIKNCLSKSCQRCGLPHYSPRAFRRYFVTLCREKNVPAEIVSRWVGHKDGGKLIQEVYSQLSNEFEREQARKLG